jgi:virginiamycin B lyase
MNGTLLTLAEFAPLACANGLKRSASHAADGLPILTGMRNKAPEERPASRLCAMHVIALLAISGLVAAQTSSERHGQEPGLKEIQVPFAELRPSAKFEIGGTADWVLVTDDAVWVAATKPYALRRIDPQTNRIVATVPLSGEACSGLAYGFGSIWAPVCGEKPGLARIHVVKNSLLAVLPITPAGPEGGIVASADSIWMVTDSKGTLTRIDPSTNSLRQSTSIPPGSYNPIFSNGVVWVSGTESNVITAVDATSGKVLESLSVGSKPRFLTSGGGSVWTLNQGDGSISRVDEKTRKLVATVQAGILGTGGDIAFGVGSVWATVFDVPLTRINGTTNKVVRQWVGKGGDSLRYGFGSIWITNYKKGLLLRIPDKSLVKAAPLS